jgi:hypothetical protein
MANERHDTDPQALMDAVRQILENAKNTRLDRIRTRRQIEGMLENLNRFAPEIRGMLDAENGRFEAQGGDIDYSPLHLLTLHLGVAEDSIRELIAGLTNASAELDELTKNKS